MSWYAIESVDEAIDTTRSFLFPIKPGQWVRLALIALFVGVGGGGLSTISNAGGLPSGMPAGPAPQEPTSVPPEPSLEALPVEPALIVAAIGAIFLVGLVLTLLSETLRLVLYDGLRTGTVRLRGPARRRFGQALRLFGFKLAVNIAFGLPFVALGAAIVLTSVDVGNGAALIVGGLLAAVGLLLWFVGYSIIMRVTTEFVAPVMVLTDTGVLAGVATVLAGPSSGISPSSAFTLSPTSCCCWRSRSARRSSRPSSSASSAPSVRSSGWWWSSASSAGFRRRSRRRLVWLPSS